MSRMTLSKDEVDALVTVALRWTESGVLEDQPDGVVEVLTVTPENATEVGARLWAANYDSYNYGAPLSTMDPTVIADWDYDGEDGQPLQVPDYEFEALAGVPRPQTAIRLAGFFSYQTSGEYWEKAEWPNGVPPFEMVFHQALVWVAAGLLGYERPAEPADYDPYDTPIENQAMHDPLWEASGWGLSSTGRDLFVRLADA